MNGDKNGSRYLGIDELFVHHTVKLKLSTSLLFCTFPITLLYYIYNSLLSVLVI